MDFAHSRCTSCAAPSCAANHRRGDSFGAQCRYKPNPNIPINYAGKPVIKLRKIFNNEDQ
ncbi:MAG: hypothetical protein GWP07_02580 [Xanthomonadaceae bacterium]|nr:hypothetical protein [Xanthomonadaceae bacterium]